MIAGILAVGGHVCARSARRGRLDYGGLLFTFESNSVRRAVRAGGSGRGSDLRALMASSGPFPVTRLEAGDRASARSAVGERSILSREARGGRGACQLVRDRAGRQASMGSAFTALESTNLTKEGPVRVEQAREVRLSPTGSKRRPFSANAQVCGRAHRAFGRCAMESAIEPALFLSQSHHSWDHINANAHKNDPTRQFVEVSKPEARGKDPRASRRWTHTNEEPTNRPASSAASASGRWLMLKRSRRPRETLEADGASAS